MSNFAFGGILLTSSVMSAPQMTQSEITREACRRLNLRSQWRESQWGGNTPFHCPFHTDKTPSMYIHMEKGVYHCFSCGKSGTIASLYYEITGSSLYKDLELPTDEFSRFTNLLANTQFEEEDYSTLGRSIQVEMQGKVIPIRESREAIQYLRKRGISFDVADTMQMAYMPAGAINGTLFNTRLLIPVYEDGTLISVEGRDVSGSQETKVLYPKDTTVNSLYDMDKLDPGKPLYVVEGLMDLAVLRTDPYFANSTAIFGATVTRRQLWLLNQYEHLILIPDNDKAGAMTTRKLIENLDRDFRILDVPRLGDIKDIGDIPTKLHTTVQALRKRGWGRVTTLSSNRVFY